MPNPKGHEDSIKNSRFKAAWRSGATRTIRVPIALADATLEYARQLDQTTQPRDTANTVSNKVSINTTETLDTMLKEEREDVAQIKRELKAVAVELHREERSMEVEKVRWQRELSDAKDELVDAKAIILKQADKIRELERGYSLKPSPAESRLRKEIGELRSQLEEVTNLAPIAIAAEFPDAAKLLSQLRGKRKKSKADLADIQTVLELLEN